MAASISLKGAKISAKFMQRTGEYLAGAAGDYIKDATPNISSILDDAKSEVAHVSSTFKNSASLIRDKSKALRNQGGLKRILNWYIDNGENDNSTYDSNLSFDIETDDASDIAEIQIGESEKNAKKIANAVFSSNQKLLEGQMELSANISATLDKQTAVITAGFDNVNATLNKILEVVTKNTSTMIEATVAANGADKSFVDGKFNLSAYKNQISKNLKNANPGMGMVMSMIPMLTSGVKLSPKDITSMAFGMLMDNNGKASKIKENVKALDQAVNDVIMQSLIRLGENKNSKFAKIFGIDGSRKEHEGGRSNLELKARPFDSIAHEAITNAIPGYLQRILVQLGGPNLKYDYRSRSFKSSNDIRRELNAVSVGNNSIRGTSSNMQKAFGTDQYGQMLYDLLLTDVGSKYGNGGMPTSFDGYIENLLTSHGVKLTAEDRKRIKMVSGNLSRKDIRNELKSNAASNNMQRNQRVSEWLNNADKYNIDTSKLKTSLESDLLHILEENGQISTLSKSKNKQFDAGVNYTNKALYAIHNLLNRGINVYQVGSSNMQKDAFKKVKFVAPKGYISERLEDPTREKRHSRVRPNSDLSNASALGPETELPEDEQLQGGKNWGGWAKGKGKALGKAILHGNSDDVRAVIMDAYGDVADLGAKALKDGAKKINDSFGNVGGFIKHKLFGTGYSYEENGKTVTVKDNEAGGVFGFMKTQISGMFSNSKKAVGNWFNSVKGYFDYGDDKSKEGKSVADKRKKLLSTSVGALAGAGILGGPIGLIMGGLAGSALSGTEGIGQKIHDLFIGRDEKGKAKGLLTRLADGVMDPIKYQFQKTAHHLGEHLKKNLLGPLSDIGLAIKDRIKNAASTTFGKVFGFIGKALLAPFKAVTKIAKAPINLIGGLTRGGISAAGNATGFGLNRIASALAVSDEAKEQLKDRRADRAADFKENDKFGDFKTWQVGERERRAKRLADLKNATAEDIAIEEVKNTEDIKDKLEDIKDILSDGGIKGSKKKKNKSKSVASETDTSSAITTAAVIATEGNLTAEDSREFNSILSESEKEKPSKGFIRNKLNKLFRSQEKDKEKTEEKKNTLWDWIKNAVSSVGGFLSGILGHLPAIAATLTALYALFGGGSIGKFFGNLKDSIWNIFFGKDSDGTKQEGSIGAQGIDAATGLIDVDSKGKPVLGWLPFTNLYHNKNDANGNYIKNVAATKAKNAVYINSVLGSVSKWGWKNMKTMKAANAVDAAALTGNAEALHASQQAYYESLWGEGGSSDASLNLSNTAKGSLRNVGKMAGNMAITAALGTATGFGVTKLSKYIMLKSGMDEERAETMSNLAGNASGRLVGVAGVASMIREQTTGRITGKKGFVTKIREALEWMAKWVGGKIAKKFPNAASKVSKVFEKAITKLESVGSKLTEKIAEKVSKVTGKSITAEGLSVLTAGALIAILGAAGALSGALFPEHLFAVASGDADALMRTISAILNGALSALSAVPIIGVTASLWDILDMVVAGLGIFDGLTLTQFIARSIYDKITDGKLQEKTATFDRSLAKYNEDHGTNLDAGTFNDMMNNTGLLDRFLNGKKSKRITGEDGQEYIVQNDDPYAGLKGKFTWIKDKITGKKRVKTTNGSTSTISESKSGRKHGGSGGKLSPSSTISSKENSSGGLYEKDWTRSATNDKRSLDTANNKISKLQSKGDVNSIFNTKMTTSADDPLKDYYQASLDISKMYGSITAMIASTGKGVLENTSASKTKLQKSLRTSSRNYTIFGGPIGGPTESNQANLADGTQNRKIDYDNYKKTTGKDYPGSYKVPTIGYPLEKNKFNITSPFGYRTAPYAGQHYGIDIVPTSSSVNTKGSSRKDAHTAEESGGGSWELKSIVNGEILDVKTNVDNGNRTFFINGNWDYQGADDDSSGNMVAIKDSASGHILKYMHLKHGSIPSSIRRGQRIKKGSKIGIIGSTGFSTGPHLHYQVEDRAGHPIDPELTFPKEKKTLEYKQSGSSKVHNSTSGSFDENVDYTYDDDGNMVEISDVSSEEDKGILGNLIDLLGNVGKQFLSMISGGLISFDQDSNSITATSAQSFVDMCAREIGTAESPAGSNNVKYNTWYYGKSASGPWCCVFVQWCFNKAGIPLPIKTASCVSLYEYYKQNDPGRIHKSNPKPGDIFVYIYSNGTNGHVGIVKSGSGSSFTTIEGNCGDKVASKVRYTNDSSFVCFISPVDFGTISAIADGNYSADIGSDMGSMWRFLKDLGYSDAGVAGILGCWQAESGGNSKKIEWDSSSTFQKYGGYDMVNNPANMDAFTKELFNHYASKGMSINRDAYKASDGHYYPGFGIAQWTGGRGKNLLDFAKKHNLRWYDKMTQMKFMAHELSNNSNYASASNYLKTATNVDEATKIFMTKYEGNKETASYGDGRTYLSERQRYAHDIYNKAKVGGFNTSTAVVTNTNTHNNKSNATDPNLAMGGPISNINSSVNYVRQNNKPSYASRKISSNALTSIPGKYTSTTSIPSRFVSSENHNVSADTDLTGVVRLITRAIDELVKITNNTASSTTYLESLNEKDFVDKGLRDSINALGKVKPKRSIPMQSSNATAVLDMARP